MKKQLIAAALLLAPLTVPAHQPKRFILDRAQAIRFLDHPSEPTSGIITILEDGARVDFRDFKGKVAVVLVGKPTAESLRDALVLSLGIVFEQPQPERCNSTTRGEECTGDARGTKQ
jgi:hypothetical protein